jgi:hypothetical protein
MKVVDAFVVLNLKKEVEAISLEEWEAKQYAENLSPKSNGIPQINRTVEKAIVLVGKNPITDTDIEEISQKVRRKIHDQMLGIQQEIGKQGKKNA